MAITESSINFVCISTIHKYSLTKKDQDEGVDFEGYIFHGTEVS